MKKAALIADIADQDCAYLARPPFGKGYAVHGINRRNSLFDTHRIDNAHQELNADDQCFSLHFGNLTDSTIVMLGYCHGTLVHTVSRLAGVVWLDDVFLAEAPDAVLLAHRDRSQYVKTIVVSLGAANHTDRWLHVQVHRPLSRCDSIDARPSLQVKRIAMKPRASLGGQKHCHRAKHWIVVTRTAEVTCGVRKMLPIDIQVPITPRARRIDRQVLERPHWRSLNCDRKAASVMTASFASRTSSATQTRLTRPPSHAFV
jgi:hypothetical protein